MTTTPMVETARAASPTPSPADEIRLLVELLRPMGASLTRRWVAALLLAPPEERAGIVESVSARLAELYPMGSGGETGAVTAPAARRLVSH